MGGQVKVNINININIKIKIKINSSSESDIVIKNVRRSMTRLETTACALRDHRTRRMRSSFAVAQGHIQKLSHVAGTPPAHAASARSRAKRGVCM